MLYDPILMRCPERLDLQRQKAEGWLLRAGGLGVCIYWDQVSIWEDGKVLDVDGGDGYRTVRAC